MTICRSRRWPIGRSRCCCAARRAARRSPATCSICTRACSSAARASTRSTSSRSPRARVKGKTGSLTGLPIIETQAGDVTAFVPTNVISITDGQIFLEGRSVQRRHPSGDERRHLGVARRRRGADRHHQALGGGIRLALAQYRELAAFSQFASDLDEATRRQLERGQRVTEVMKQKQYAPMSVAQMALSIYAVNNGYMDKVERSKIVDFEAALQSFARSKHNARRWMRSTPSRCSRSTRRR